jgi:hypothetical protein
MIVAMPKVSLIRVEFCKEPRGQIYADLIATLRMVAVRSLLVVRYDLAVSDRGWSLLSRMEPWRTSITRRARWPGTELFGGATAEVHEHHLSEELVSILRTAVEGLYEWRNGFPEDLALIREDGQAILETTAHEEQAALSLEPLEWDKLMERCPAIASYLER